MRRAYDFTTLTAEGWADVLNDILVSQLTSRFSQNPSMRGKSPDQIVDRERISMFLGMDTFGYHTGDFEMHALWTEQTLAACQAILDRTAQHLDRTRDAYRSFCYISHMPFIHGRITWDAVITDAWFVGGVYTLPAYDYLHSDTYDFSPEQWEAYIGGVLIFARRYKYL